MRRRSIPLALVLLGLPSLASAHVATPQVGWSGPDPGLLAAALAALAAYAVGYVRLRRRASLGRMNLARRGGLFVAGWCVLAGATLSPLHDLGGQSFTAHMAEHELIMLAAAPLLVLAWPLGVFFWAFPAGGRQRLAGFGRSAGARSLWRLLADPWMATVLQGAALWVWHLPSLFDRALKSEAWHVAQHLSFFVTALLFWSAMLRPQRSRWTAAACLFATSMITGALGAFMALSESPWYGPYASLGLAAFGLTPAQDQELAGALMWVPGGLLHAVVAMALLGPQLRGQGVEPADA